MATQFNSTYDKQGKQSSGDDCNCNCHSEIQRDGSSQLSRFLNALDPSYAPIDDRNIEELLVFAKRYAAQLRFYDIPESNINGSDPSKISWKEFFRRDMAVVAASIAVIDLDQIKKDYDENRERTELQPSSQTFAALFDPILGMLVRIDKWYSLAIPENPVYKDLQLAINSNLRIQVKSMIGYQKGFLNVDPNHPIHLDLTSIQNDDAWGLNDPVDADTAIYKGTDPVDRIRYAALFVDDVFNAFFGFISNLVKESENYMQFALEQYPAHKPHMALFIAFLKLFKLAQDQMNGLTRRMLNFYYRDVLHLKEKPSVPDRAHIVFELAKDVAEYNLEQFTSLNGGKDNSGKDQVYKTEEGLVINQAKVKELKTIFIDQSGFDSVSNSKIIKSVYARPIANSLDGFGEKITDPSGKWPTFGKGLPNLVPKNICEKIDLFNEIADRKDQAQLGFAIASPQLILQGGNRLITLFLDSGNKLFTQTKFEIWLSAEKEWLRINREMTKDEFDKLVVNEIFNKDEVLGAGYFLENEYTLNIFLPLNEQSIIPYDAKLHPGRDYKTTFPIMQLMLGPEINIPAATFRALTFKQFSISVRVGSINQFKADLKTLPSHFDGLKTLTVINDDGPLDSNNSFDPFTANPFFGGAFYIGSNEIFNKRVVELAINIRHQMEGLDNYLDRPPERIGDKESDQYKVSVLEKKIWQSLCTSIATDFTEGALTQNILFVRSKEDALRLIGQQHILERTPISYPIELNEKTSKGFIQIEMGTLLSEIFTQRPNTTTTSPELMQFIIKAMKVKELSVSYYSELQQLDPEIDQLFHVYPFGVVEVNLDITNLIIQRTRASAFLEMTSPAAESGFSIPGRKKAELVVDADGFLLPQFTYLSPYANFQGTAPVSPVILRNFLRPRVIDPDPQLTRLMLEASGFREKTEGSANQYSGIDEEEGLLFIGLENLKPLQTISLLFQFAEGSAGDEDNDPPPIHWSYLTNNEWRPMKGENLISDGTYGLQTTGIIKIDVPKDATSHNTIITDGLLWFCASVTQFSNRIPQLVDVVAQAVVAKFEDQENDQTHFDKALIAGSISKLTNSIADISKVQQPFASFDGKHKEVGKEFYTRVSERLRHKGRAINAWDYEHIVLERFPGIYKVKCITHTDPNCLCRSGKEKKSEPATQDPEVYQKEIKFPATSDAADTVQLEEVVNQIKSTRNAHIRILTYYDSTIANSKTLSEKRVEFINQYLLGKGITNSIGSGVSDDSVLNKQNKAIIFVTSKPVPVNTDKIACCGPQIAPGHVLLIPIANLKNRNAANPLQPKTSRRALLAIEEYLKKRTSPFIHVHAKNPKYEQVIVAFRVKFYTGTDKGFYLKKLNEEIVHYLTPWAFDEKAEVKFGQKIYGSSIINFIEERPYVDFITDFIMGICRDECCPVETIYFGVDNRIDIRENPPPPPPPPAAGTSGRGNKTGKVVDGSGNPLPGVSVMEKGSSNATTTANDGSFNIFVNNPDPIIVFSLSGFPSQEVSAGSSDTFDINMAIASIPVNINPVNIRSESSSGKVIETLNKICGCNDLEYLLQEESNFQGEAVAIPSTQRSILVSVPKHIIIPYEEPPYISPCEQRAIDKTKKNTPQAYSLESTVTRISLPHNMPGRAGREKKNIDESTGTAKKESVGRKKRTPRSRPEK